MKPTIISYSNFGYSILAKNLLINIDRILCDYNIYFYCLDNETKNFLEGFNFKNNNIIFELFEQPSFSNYEKYGTEGFNIITLFKFQIIRKALEKNDLVYYVDSDIVFLKPFPENYFEKFLNKDIVFQYDGLYSEDFSVNDLYGTWACTGNTLYRRTLSTIDLIDKVLNIQINNIKLNDQDSLKKLLDDLEISDIRNYKPTNLDIFPEKEFVNGSWIKISNYSMDLVYVFHANYVIGLEEKINSLKKINMWFCDN